MRIAFVCLGNICRSPMAEAVTRSLVDQAGLSSEVTVESFGTADYHVGEGADPQALAALARAGWPDTGHRGRQIRAADLERLDLVLCADSRNLESVRRLAGSADPAAPAAPAAPAGSPVLRLLLGDRDVPDPWGRPDRVFDEVLAEIERACGALVAGLAAGTD